MNMYNSMKEAFRQGYKERSQLYKARLVKWDSEPSVMEVDKPTNIARARELGYKAKQGIVVARVRVLKGKSKRHGKHLHRKITKMGKFYSYNKSLQAIAEERAARKFTNCEVLNSYFVGDTGQKKFFEVILLDREGASIKNDPQYANLLAQRNRANRGLTMAGRKHRGISMKGDNTLKNRPSRRSSLKRCAGY
jgi:large subunit ribosomal protein L15e